MPRKVLTQADYDAMVAAFEKDAPRYSHYAAARHCGADPKTLKRGWDTGWPTKHWRPIKTVVEERLAQQKKQKLLDAANQRNNHQKVKEEQLQAQQKAATQESQIATLSRGGALNILAASTTLVSSARQLADTAKRKIDEDLARPDGDERQLTALQAVTLLDRLAACQSRIVSMARISLELERLVAAKPVQPNTSAQREPMTLDEAALRLDSAHAALAQARQVAGSSVSGAPEQAHTVGKRVTP